MSNKLKTTNMSYKKYYLYKKQVSTDGGQTWQDVQPIETVPSGDPIATYETLAECETGSTKFSAVYSNEQTYSLACNGNSTLTSGETQPSGYQYSAMTEAIVGDCVINIDNWIFYNHASLSSVTIGSGVTSIGDYAFAGCTSLTRLTVEAITPPTLGNDVFYYTPFASHSGHIYVPAASVNLYKEASGWSTYASRIQAIT